MFHRFDVPKVSADFHARPSFVTILPSFETGTLEASIKPRLFKREKLAGNLFKSAAINYRHVRGLSRLPPLFILVHGRFHYRRSCPRALFSFPIRSGGFRDFGYQVVVEMALAITSLPPLFPFLRLDESSRWIFVVESMRLLERNCWRLKVNGNNWFSFPIFIW